MMSIIDQIKNLKEQWNLVELINIAEDYLEKNPYEKDIVLKLVNACWHQAKYSKLEQYSKLLIEHSDYVEIAKYMLMYAYARLNRKDEARKLIEHYPKNASNYESIMLNNYLYDSDNEKQGLITSLLWSSFHNMLYAIQEKSNIKYNGITIRDSSYTIGERIIILTKALKLYEIMYEEEDYYSESLLVMDIHLTLALLYLQNNEKDECYQHLKEALKQCVAFETYDLTEAHESVFLKGIVANPRTRWSSGAKQSMIDDLEADFFNEIKNEDNFIEIYHKLKEI